MDLHLSLALVHVFFRSEFVKQGDISTGRSSGESAWEQKPRELKNRDELASYAALWSLRTTVAEAAA